MYTGRFRRAGGSARSSAWSSRTAWRRLGLEGVLAGGFVLAWSSGFIGARIGLEAAGPITVLTWRFLITAGLLLAWFALRRRRLTRRQVGVQAAVGVLAQGVYLGAMVLAVLLGVALGTAALAGALQPLLAGVLARRVVGEPARARQWSGLVIGLAGVALVLGDSIQAHRVSPWACALPFIATAGLVAATLIERKSAGDTPVLDALMIQCSTCAVLFGALALATGEAMPPGDGLFWLAIAWFIAFSTIGGYGLYWLILKRGSVTRVSSLIYLTPPTTMIWASLMFGQRIGMLAAAGLVVCLIAVLIVTRAAPAGPARGLNLTRPQDDPLPAGFTPRRPDPGRGACHPLRR